MKSREIEINLHGNFILFCLMWETTLRKICLMNNLMLNSVMNIHTKYGSIWCKPRDIESLMYKRIYVYIYSGNSPGESQKL